MRAVQAALALVAWGLACAGPGDDLVSAATEDHTLQNLYQRSLLAAQQNAADAESRYVAVTAFCRMYSLNLHKVRSYQVQGEYKRALRAADQAVAIEKAKAYPLLAKVYILSTLPEVAYGPRTPEEGRTELRWFKETNTRTGEVKRYQKVVYVFDDQDPRLLAEVEELLARAVRLEPNNPEVWLVKAHAASKPETKLACVRRAAEFGGKSKYRTSYLLRAYEAYKGTGNQKDAAIAKAALDKILSEAEGKVWVKLFRKVNEDFAAPA